MNISWRIYKKNNFLIHVSMSYLIKTSHFAIRVSSVRGKWHFLAKKRCTKIESSHFLSHPLFRQANELLKSVLTYHHAKAPRLDDIHRSTTEITQKHWTQEMCAPAIKIFGLLVFHGYIGNVTPSQLFWPRSVILQRAHQRTCLFRRRRVI